MPDLRKFSIVGAIISVLAWAGAASAAYSGHSEIASIFTGVFAIFGFGAALCWVIYCAQIALSWLSNRSDGT